MNNYYITIIIFVLVGLLYINYKKPLRENFADLPQSTRTVLGQKIRNDNNIEDTINIINRQIEEREEMADLEPPKETPKKKCDKKVEEIPVETAHVFTAKQSEMASVDLKDYVHKNNVPDITQYVHKNSIPDMTNYIHRDKVPDMKRYILKTQVPPFQI